MTQAMPAQDFDSDILDLHVDADNVVVATPAKLRVLDLVKGKIRWALENVKVGSTACTIRSARFYTMSANQTGQETLLTG